mmetsp:Transcript_20529/g.51836  ORF Transcript_20529/g.51836 Transcript_20529/m.51836 type:complete len:213 (+) Transcript_20529:2872-3510(+)
MARRPVAGSAGGESNRERREHAGSRSAGLLLLLQDRGRSAACALVRVRGPAEVLACERAASAGGEQRAHEPGYTSREGVGLDRDVQGNPAPGGGGQPAPGGRGEGRPGVWGGGVGRHEQSDRRARDLREAATKTQCGVGQWQRGGAGPFHAEQLSVARRGDAEGIRTAAESGSASAVEPRCVDETNGRRAKPGRRPGAISAAIPIPSAAPAS